MAHGLEALATETRGILHLQAGPAADLEALRLALLKYPWHRVFIETDPGEGEHATSCRLCLGSTCHPHAQNPDEILSPLKRS